MIDHLTSVTDIAESLATGSKVEIRKILKIDPTLQLWGDF